MKFQTDYQYTDRMTKSKYVWLKYQSILNGHVLDVGADECHLKQYLADATHYTGIGLGGTLDIQVNLEKEPIPFADRSFDCVLCLDVLEHLDNIHDVFDELCRVASRYMLVSLPNPYATFYNMLQNGYYREAQPMKFYGLPKEKPEDRHKWFFSPEEAETFIQYRAGLPQNRMNVVQIDSEGGRDVRGLSKLARCYLFRSDIDWHKLHTGTIWAVLEKCCDG